MANDLITGDAKAATAQQIAGLYASIVRDDRTRTDMLPAIPSKMMRDQLLNYRRDLRAKLQPIGNSMTDRDKASKAIGALLQGYLNAKSPDFSATLRAYTSMIFDQPLFALLEALDDFRNGRVFDIGKEGERIPFTLDHAPSAPRLLAQIKKRAGDVQEEHFKVSRILGITKAIGAPEISEEERARVGEQMQQLARHLGNTLSTTIAEDRKKIREEADAARERAARIIENARRHNLEAEISSQIEQANG